MSTCPVCGHYWAWHGESGCRVTTSATNCTCTESETTMTDKTPPYVVSIDPTRLTWDQRVPTGKELRAWLESLPGGEFATGLLVLADALDGSDWTTAPKADDGLRERLEKLVEDLTANGKYHASANNDYQRGKGDGILLAVEGLRHALNETSADA